jgi:BirA family biotin operon repressor/biotin-[acetyl-CoA-carboxylase] ligase
MVAAALKDAALPRRAALVRLLADGRFHSGARLAQDLDVSRTTVWKHVRELADWGLETHSVPRRGYRLTRELDLLDAAEVRAHLSSSTAAALRTLQVIDELTSTNAALLAVTDLPAGRFDLCVAEFQTAGRGRRGRTWIAPYASGICLSCSWLFRESPSQLSALSLAVGVAILRALRGVRVEGAALKWPNDVLYEGRKLGGILCELRAEAAGPAYVVIGIGLNVELPAAARTEIGGTGLAAADLVEAGKHGLPSRSVLVAHIANALYTVMCEFERGGLPGLLSEWRGVDALHNQSVQVIAANGSRTGIARGIDLDGALRVEFVAGVERIVSGEISLRPVAT